MVSLPDRRGAPRPARRARLLSAHLIFKQHSALALRANSTHQRYQSQPLNCQCLFVLPNCATSTCVRKGPGKFKKALKSTACERRGVWSGCVGHLRHLPAKILALAPTIQTAPPLWTRLFRTESSSSWLIKQSFSCRRTA